MSAPILWRLDMTGVSPTQMELAHINAELGRKVLGDSGLNIIAASSLTDAAEKVVAAARGAK